MEQNLNNKLELKDKLISFYNSNKLKIYSLVSILLIIFISLIILKINFNKKNILISEKYILAGILETNNKEKSKNLYEEIINSDNEFYSILALNSILEKNLISDENKIINYFNIVEKLNKNHEKKDLIVFKKALYLIKISKIDEGNQLLNNLIEKNSKLKFLAEEILIN